MKCTACGGDMEPGLYTRIPRCTECGLYDCVTDFDEPAIVDTQDNTAELPLFPE